MNGFILLIPFLLIRFGLLSIVNKDAIRRAAHFPPIKEKEMQIYWTYQISNVVIFVYLCFLVVVIDYSWLFYTGLALYGLGLILCVITIVNFAKPSSEGLNQNGLYRFSRNPMYVAYFICFVGCAMLTQSILLGGFIFVFQVSAHGIILFEERWCIEQFGETYKQYIKNVRRYI